MSFFDGLVKRLAGVAKSVTPPWLAGMTPSGEPTQEVERLQERMREVHGRTTETLARYRAELETYRQLVYGSSYFLILGNGIVMDDDSFSPFASSIDKYSQDPSTTLFPSRHEGPVQDSATIGIPAPRDPDELPGRASSLSAHASQAVPHLGLLAQYLKGVPGASEGGSFGPQSTDQLVVAGRSCGIMPTPPGTPITKETVGQDVGVDAVRQVLSNASLVGLAAPGMEFLRVIGLGQLFGDHSGPDLRKMEQAEAKAESYLQELGRRLDEVRSLSGREIDLFVRMLRELDEISHQQPMPVPEPSATAPRSFLPVMERATARYATFIDLRNAWVRAIKRNPEIDVETFVRSFRTLSANDLSETQIRQYLEVLAQYSGMISRFQGTAFAGSS